MLVVGNYRPWESLCQYKCVLYFRGIARWIFTEIYIAEGLNRTQKSVINRDMARPHELTDDGIDPKSFVKALQAEITERRGGWEGAWARKKGLTRAMVTNWATRGRVPGYWRLALKASLKGLNSV